MHAWWPRKQQEKLWGVFCPTSQNLFQSRKCDTNSLKVINSKWWCFQGNNFFCLSSNQSLMQSFPQSPVQSQDDQIRLETMSPLISKYHTLTGTWTTAKGFSPGTDILMEIYTSVNSVLVVSLYNIPECGSWWGMEKWKELYKSNKERWRIPALKRKEENGNNRSSETE